MAIDVRPNVYIDGKRVACHTDTMETEPVVIRGFTIHWGREEYQSPDTSPASVDVTLLDLTDEWATRIRESRAIGLEVRIVWLGYTSTNFDLIGPVTMFRGRVSEATAKPHAYHAPDGRRGWVIELSCADATADYGNANAVVREWPQETMLVRANRVRDLGLQSGSKIKEVYFWPGYMKGRCAPLDVQGKSALELLGEMFASMGNDSYAYDPEENVVRQAIRLSQPISTYLATFDDSRGAVLPVANDITVDGKTYPGIGLGGCELVGEPEIHADPTTDINRLECTWDDWAADFDSHTTVKEDVQLYQARRVMKWNSWFDAGEVIDPTLDNVWNRAREEGRRPRHPDFTFKPGFTFVSERMARWALMAWENTRAAFISGNLAYQWLMGDSMNYPPVVSPIGGQTTFDPQLGWACMFHVHWIHNTTPVKDSATWESLRQVRTTYQQEPVPWWYKLMGLPSPPVVEVGEPTPARDLKWGDATTFNGYHWDSSVTWGDTKHIPTTGTHIKDVLD